MGLRMEKFNIMGGSLKNSIFKGVGGFLKNQYIGGNCPNRGGRGQFPNLRGAWQKRGGGGYF